MDALAADVDGAGKHPRLLILSAGNIQDSNAWFNYPHSNDTDGVHDPAQAWNALTVGAFTEQVQLTEPDTEDYAPIAPTRRSVPVQHDLADMGEVLAVEADVVFEGGNAAKTRFRRSSRTASAC